MKELNPIIDRLERDLGVARAKRRIEACFRDYEDLPPDTREWLAGFEKSVAPTTPLRPAAATREWLAGFDFADESFADRYRYATPSTVKAACEERLRSWSAPSTSSTWAFDEMARIPHASSDDRVMASWFSFHTSTAQRDPWPRPWITHNRSRYMHSDNG